MVDENLTLLRLVRDAILSIVRQLDGGNSQRRPDRLFGFQAGSVVWAYPWTIKQWDVMHQEMRHYWKNHSTFTK